MRKKQYIPSRIQDNKHELMRQQPLEHMAIADSVDLAKKIEKKKKKKMRHGQY